MVINLHGIKKLYSAILERAILDFIEKYEKGKYLGSDPEEYFFKVYKDNECPELPEFEAICELIEVSPIKIRGYRFSPVAPF